MKKAEFPKGWDEKRVKKVLSVYEHQSEDDALAEDEAGMEASETVMRVPKELVSIVRELIAKRQG